MMCWLDCKQDENKMFNPIAMQNPVTLPEFTAAVTSLQRFSDEEVLAMQKEFSTYVARIREFSTEGHDLSTHAFKSWMLQCMNFWRTKWSDIPNIAKVARFCITLSPSSASAERVFSVVKSMFAVQQMTQTLDDHTEASVMLVVNHHPPPST